MIIYNGQTGSLGAYVARPATDRDGEPPHALQSRLEARADLADELRSLEPRARASTRVALVQMAAKVSVPACEGDPDGARRTNVEDTVATVDQVCRWAANIGVEIGVVYVSSGHVYARQEIGAAIGESGPVAPRSVYARTKLEAEQHLGELMQKLGVPLTVARVFGLVAPVQPPHYVLPALIRRAIDEQVQGIPGLSAVRDYLDARDVCEVLVDLALRDPHPNQVVNVCSGRPVRIQDILEGIVRLLKPDRAAQLASCTTEAPPRSDDVPWLVGDPGRLVSLLGRHPQRIPLAQTIDDAIRSLRR
jgi:nucleoside-diphosphate-sugar epimerase